MPTCSSLDLASRTDEATLPPEPIMDVAHLGHLELLTPKPEESLRFFVDVLGMTESGRRGESVYLRAWDDDERYSLKLTGSHSSGLGHAAVRLEVVGVPESARRGRLVKHAAREPCHG